MAKKSGGVKVEVTSTTRQAGSDSGVRLHDPPLRAGDHDWVPMASEPPKCGDRPATHPFICTRERGHRSRHAAHGVGEVVLADWPRAPTALARSFAPENAPPREYQPRLEPGDPGFVAKGNEPFCRARSEDAGAEFSSNWVCTLSQGHPGRHVAHAGTRMIADWPAKGT